MSDTDITLPSGAVLICNVAPFKDAKALFQSLMKVWAGSSLVPFSMVDGGSAMFASAFSSPEVEKALWPCLIRSLYNGEKIVPDVFEPENAREDFIPVCLTVVQKNIIPFTKGLFSGSETPSSTLTESPESRPQEKTTWSFTSGSLRKVTRPQ